MESQFRRLNKNSVINLANVTYIEKAPGDNLNVHFVGITEPKTFFCSNEEGKALLKWLEQTAPLVGGEVTYAESPWK
jgi:hypothetical protein